jgi:glutaminyl-tRNA synthetase
MVDSIPGALVFNRTVSLRDTWAKITATDRAAADRGDKTGRRRAATDRPRKGPEERGASAEVTPGAERLVKQFGISAEQARVLAEDEVLAAFFDQAVSVHDSPRGVAGWIVGDVSRALKDRGGALPFTGAAIGSLVALIDDGLISRGMAKEVFVEMVEGGGEPREIVERRGLRVLSDTSAIEAVVEKLIAEHPQKAEAYRGGRTGLLGFFVGQALKATGGAADPELVAETVRGRLA